MSIEELKDAVSELVCMVEDSTTREHFEELDSMGVEIINALEEAEQYKLALFAVIRSHSMETALEQGLSMTMHSMLAVKIMEQVIEKCDFGALKILYDEALAKMGGK